MDGPDGRTDGIPGVGKGLMKKAMLEKSAIPEAISLKTLTLVCT
jgi:hypothetical protein